MDDVKTTVAVALAEGICPGCVCSEKLSSDKYFPHNSFNHKPPCPHFHPDNFYYDKKVGHFRCRNWVDSEGNTGPQEKTAPDVE